MAESALIGVFGKRTFVSRNREAVRFNLILWIGRVVLKTILNWIVWWFTDGALHYAKVRNANLNTSGNARGIVVIPGAEPPIMNAESPPHEYAIKLRLCHFGSLAKDRSLSTILLAALELIKKYPGARKAIQIHAYGAPLDELSKYVLESFPCPDLLFAHGRLEKDHHTNKSGRERVIEKMQMADVLILLHGNDEWCAEYIPSKYYEYLWTGRPIWAITHRNVQLDKMIEERGSYLSHSGDLESINMTLERIWLDWSGKKLLRPQWMPIGVDQAAYKILAEVQASTKEAI